MAQIFINCDMINSKSLLNLKHTIKPPMEQKGDLLCPATCLGWHVVKFHEAGTSDGLPGQTQPKIKWFSP